MAGEKTAKIVAAAIIVAIIVAGAVAYALVAAPAKVVTTTVTTTVTKTVTATPVTSTTPTTPTPTTPAVEVIKIGVLGPFTGPVARTGQEFRGAVEMAFEEIGYKIGHYKIQLVWIDSQSDPEKATRAYEDAVLREGIVAGLLNWHSSVAVAVMDVAAKYKIPHFGAMGATGIVNEKWRSAPEKYKYWAAKGWPRPEKLVIAYVEAVEQAIEKGIWKPANKKFAVIVEDTDWGRSWGKAIAEELEKRGWEQASFDVFSLSPPETEFYPLLSKLKAADVRLVAITSTAPQSYAALIKQIREVGLKALVIADGLGWVGEWYKLTGEASDYCIDEIPQWTAKSKPFRDKFVEKYGFEPSPSAAGLAYDLSKFFIKILQETYNRYGKLTSETIMRVIEDVQAGKIVYHGIIMDTWKYTPETVPDPVIGEGYYIFPVLQYFKGEGKIIWPEGWKEQDLVLPPWLQDEAGPAAGG